MKGNLNRVLLALVLLALLVNAVFMLDERVGDTRLVVWLCALAALAFADLALAALGILFTTRSLGVKEKSSLAWARWGFVTAVVVVLLLAATPFAMNGGRASSALLPEAEHVSAVLFLYGITLAPFVYGQYRESLRLGGSRGPRRSHGGEGREGGA